MSWANFFHERPQSGLLHGWNEVVVQATLAEQGVCPPLGGAGFEMLIESESLAGGAEQRQKAVGLLYRGVSWRSQKYGPSRATRAPDGVVREPLVWLGLPDPVALLQMFSSVEFFRPRSVRVRWLSVSGEQKDNSSSLLMNCIRDQLLWMQPDRMPSTWRRLVRKRLCDSSTIILI